MEDHRLERVEYWCSCGDFFENATAFDSHKFVLTHGEVGQAYLSDEEWYPFAEALGIETEPPPSANRGEVGG